MSKVWLAFAVCLPLCAADWKLVWSDEFNGRGLPDSSKWTYEEGYVRNREAQYYTKARTENVRQENGHLIIEARREPEATRPNPKASITSGSVTTEGKAEWRYGRLEIRAKLPTGRGTWPAIWMLGRNHQQAGWPLCGEIDIMENVGYEPDVIHANIHTQAYNHGKKTNKGAKTTVARPWQDFHVYSVEWTPDQMDFFVDGKSYFTYINEKTGVAAWPFDQPFYLILNVAIGGTWGGTMGVDDSIFPQRMEVDYVRVYQRATT